jgi:UDPglucose 6-dehydrogenase
MKDAICVGWGFVGKATAHAFGIKDYYSRSEATVPFDKIKDFKYIFVCLPTPTITKEDDDSHLQDINAIENLIEQSRTDDNIFIIRSTILPGTCRKLADKYKANIVHVPEFLTEKTWKQDTEWPDIVVIGGEDIKVVEQVAGIYRMRYKGAALTVTDTKTSEMIKYAVNCFYALKVVYANQIYDECKRNDINYEVVKDAMYARKWMSTNHFDINHQGGRGAGGKCLKKDLEAFSEFSASNLLWITNKLNGEYINGSGKE